MKFDLTGMHFCLEYTKLGGKIKEKGTKQSLKPAPHVDNFLRRKGCKIIAFEIIILIA
jgi:hypothetical protein